MRSKQRQADGEGRWLQSLRCGGDITSLFPGSPAGLNQSNPRSESCGRGERSGEAGLGKGRGNPKAQREEMKLSSLWPQAALVAITTVGAVTAAAKTLFSVLPTLGPDMTIVEVSGVWPDRKREAQGTRKWWEELEKAIPLTCVWIPRLTLHLCLPGTGPNSTPKLRELSQQTLPRSQPDPWRTHERDPNSIASALNLT